MTNDEKLEFIETTVRDIHTAIIGNPSLGQKGIVPRLEAVELQVAQHDKKLLIWGTGFSAITVLCVTFKEKLVKFFSAP